MNWNIGKLHGLFNCDPPLCKDHFALIIEDNEEGLCCPYIDHERKMKVKQEHLTHTHETKPKNAEKNWFLASRKNIPNWNIYIHNFELTQNTEIRTEENPLLFLSDFEREQIVKEATQRHLGKRRSISTEQTCLPGPSDTAIEKKSCKRLCWCRDLRRVITCVESPRPAIDNSPIFYSLKALFWTKVYLNLVRVFGHLQGF